MLLMAAREENINGMTVAWGGFGVMWGQSVMYFAVRPSRYTFSLLTKGADVSLIAFPADYATALAFCGSHSGRDGDKLKAAGLTPIRMPSGGYGCREAELVLAGHLLYRHAMSAEEILQPEDITRFYEKEAYHTFFIASLEKIYTQS